MYEIPHLRVNVDVQNKMAAGSDSIYDEFDGVRKALDEEFGEDISKLDDLKDFMKKTEDYDGILRYKVISPNLFLLVRKCRAGKLCKNLQQFFPIGAREQSIRNNGIVLNIPVDKLKVTKSSFSFMGVKIYNFFPI